MIFEIHEDKLIAKFVEIKFQREFKLYQAFPPSTWVKGGGGGQECASKVSGARCFEDFSEISVTFFHNACGLERQTSK